MGDKPKIYGKPVDKDEAQACMDRYNEITETFREEQNSRQTSGIDPKIEAANQYYQKKYNAFIFSKELVMRFFEEPNKAGYLVVLMGAQPKEDLESNIKKNDPTVIVVGCTESENGKFVSLDIPYPATEHPPVQVMSSFPDHASFKDTQIILELI